MRSLLFLFLTLGLPCSFYLEIARAQEAGDGISTSDSSIDFGPVALGTTVTRKVILKNRSDAEVRIDKINWTCGCIQAAMSDSRIVAHGESELAVRTRPAKPGKHAGTLFLYDSRGQSHQIQASVEGIPAITVQPEVLQFGAIVQGSMPEKPLSIQFSELQNYVVERLHFDADLFEIERLPDPDEKANGLLRFSVRVKKSAPAGEFRESLAVYLKKDQETVACVVSLNGRVTSELYATPASLRVQVKPNSVPVQRSVILRSATGDEFKVISFRANSPMVSAKIRLQNPALAIIEISVATPDVVNLPQTATLSIETDVATHPELTVPIELVR